MSYFDEAELKNQYTLRMVEKMIAHAQDTIPHWPALFRINRGGRIFDLLYEMEELCVAASLKYFKKTTLQDLDIKNHQLQLALLQAASKSYMDKRGKSRYLISPGDYKLWVEMSTEAGRLIGGWRQTLATKGGKAE